MTSAIAVIASMIEFVTALVGLIPLVGHPVSQRRNDNAPHHNPYLDTVGSHLRLGLYEREECIQQLIQNQQKAYFKN